MQTHENFNVLNFRIVSEQIKKQDEVLFARDCTRGLSNYKNLIQILAKGPSFFFFSLATV